MNQKKVRMGFFASSDSLRSRIREISARQSHSIRIAVQGLEDAIPVGRKMEKDGIEVIISRRGTAHLLRENLHIPVIAFPQSTLAILLSLKKASEYGHKILIPCFRNPLSEIRILEELLDVQLILGIYADKKSLDRAVLVGLEKGCQVAIGGNVTRQFAESRGLEFVEIVTSEEEITATLETARSAALSNRKQQATAQRYLSIIDAASDGIIAVDEKGRITTINRAARRLLNIEQEYPAGQPLGRYLPNTPMHQVLKTRQPLVDRVEKIFQDQYVFNHIPVFMNGDVIGGVSTFKEFSRVMRSENVVRRALSKGLVAKYRITDLVHQSAAMRDIVTMAEQFAKTKSTILIMGETGTGKEVLAQSIHNLSARSQGPFVSVNCAALPEQLLESELFGYEGGAFTGSKKGGSPGRFEIAHNGTIFLDEIDTTSENVQIRLLRILQEREVMRIGGDRKILIDVRVIAAASRDLGSAVHEARFREDLFFRLNVLRIHIPPLRERIEDIPVLLEFFIQHICSSYGLAPIEIPFDYLIKLKEYSWPGNVRQLRNFTERLVLNCHLRCGTDVLETLYEELISYSPGRPVAVPPSPEPDVKGQLQLHRASQEATIIRRALEEAKYCKSRTAQNLGMSRTTLWRKMKAHGIK